MAAGTDQRTKTAAAVLVVVAILAAIAGLVIVQFGHYQPDDRVASEHPEVGSNPCTSCKEPLHDYVHEDPYTGSCERCHETSSWLVTHYEHANVDFNTSFHGVIGCERCHTEGEPIPSAACETCHQARSPHKAGALACEPCHTVLAWSLQRPVPGDHLSLEGGHAGVGCFECHTSAVDAEVPLVRGCVDCHGENHGITENCERCHEPSLGWQPSAGFDHSAFFRLEGKHTKVDCAGCHTKSTFAGTPTVCQGCHEVEHKNLPLCVQCHTPAGFVPANFDHDRYFPITGGHQKLACVSCHPKGIYDGTPTVCTGCHGAAHGGLTACQDCHTTNGFVPSTFKHASRFPLAGTHAKVACSSCHPGNRYASNIGRGSTACTACHTSPHGSGVTACTSCHKPTAWSDLVLTEHPGEIKLGAEHTGRACTLCHPALKFVDEAPKPCQDCHRADVPHVGPENCIDCHRPTTWAELHFTHPQIGVHQEQAQVDALCLRCHPGPDFTIVDCRSCHTFTPSSTTPSATPLVPQVVPVTPLVSVTEPTETVAATPTAQ